MGWTISCISFIFCILFIFGWNKKSKKRRHSAEKISFQQTIDKSSISIFKLGGIILFEFRFLFSWDSFFSRGVFFFFLTLLFSFSLCLSLFLLSSLSVPFCFLFLLVSIWKKLSTRIYIIYLISICDRLRNIQSIKA